MLLLNCRREYIRRNGILRNSETVTRQQKIK